MKVTPALSLPTSLKGITITGLVLLTGCASFQKHQSWAFIQSVGGVSIGKPYAEMNEVVIPLNLDVSGRTSITQKPSAEKLQVYCSDLKKRLNIIDTPGNYEIAFSIGIDELDPNEPTLNNSCKSINFPSLPDGKYSVFYELDGEQMQRVGSFSWKN